MKIAHPASTVVRRGADALQNAIEEFGLPEADTGGWKPAAISLCVASYGLRMLIGNLLAWRFAGRIGSGTDP